MLFPYHHLSVLYVKYHIHRRLIDGDKEITWVVCKKYLKFKLIALEYTMIRHNQEEIYSIMTGNKS